VFNALQIWLDAPVCSTIGEAGAYLDTLKSLAVPAMAQGAKIHDARIAAICIRSRVKALWTADRDFSRFPGLKTHNPLVTG
jgi:hypothetical protein